MDNGDSAESPIGRSQRYALKEGSTDGAISQHRWLVFLLLPFSAVALLGLRSILFAAVN